MPMSYLCNPNYRQGQSEEGQFRSTVEPIARAERLSRGQRATQSRLKELTSRFERDAKR